jgi:hypothetical protein
MSIRHSIQNPPPLWVMLARAHQLDERLARTWWQSLCRSRWSATVAWRQAVILSAEVGNPQTFSATHWTPPKLVATLEDLVREQLLSRRAASCIQERLLACVDRHGQWK